jgi:hypothetical protein
MNTIVMRLIFRNSFNKLPLAQRGIIAGGLMGAALRQPLLKLLTGFWKLSWRGAKEIAGLGFGVLIPQGITLDVRTWVKFLAFTIMRKIGRLFLLGTLLMPLRLLIMEYLISQTQFTTVKELVIPMLNKITVPWLHFIDPLLTELKNSTILSSVIQSGWFWSIIGLLTLGNVTYVTYEKWCPYVEPIWAGSRYILRDGWSIVKWIGIRMGQFCSHYTFNPFRNYMIINHPNTWGLFIEYIAEPIRMAGSLVGYIYGGLLVSGTFVVEMGVALYHRFRR